MPVDAVAGVVLAAGAGTRLRPLTDLCPKPLCPIGDSTLLDRAIAQVSAAVGVPVAVNVHHGADAMFAHLAGRDDVHVSFEQPEALGTAGAIAELQGWVDRRAALVVNADTLHGEDLASFVQGWDGERVRVLMVGEPPFGPRSGLVASIVPWPDVVRLRAEPSGLWEVLWRPALSEGRLGWVRAVGPVVDCATVSDYVRANRYLAEGRIGPVRVP